jgi:hypothetical protein
MTATYDKIATTTLGSNTPSLDFTSIPATYTDLVLVIRYAGSSNDQNSLLRFNNDTASNYSRTALLGNGSSASSVRSSSATFIQMVTNYGAGTSLASGNYQIIQIQNYSNTTTHKTALVRTYAQNDSGAGEVGTTVGLWRSTSAINQVTYSQGSGNIIAGSTATLYGIKSA